MKNLSLPRGLLIATVAILVSGPAPAQDAVSQAENPLAGFERLVGGRWQLDQSFQEFEWGPGRKSVRARSYFLKDGVARPVSEGHWYWHPGEAEIKGAVTATDMPVELFEFTTRFEGDRVVSDLVTYDAGGGRSEYVETWEFLDENRYEWTLFSPGPEGLAVMMQGTYTRVESPDPKH